MDVAASFFFIIDAMFQDLLFCFSNIIDAELYGRAVNFPTS
jgi:hypothetical protein